MERRNSNEEQTRELAHSLGCITGSDLRALAGITEKTEEAWRKRGTGPAYILFGNEYLYPRQAVAEHLATLTRARPTAICAKGVL